jgi:hypothetical protein
MVPPPPTPLAEIKTSVPSAVKENHTSSEAFAGQQVGIPRLLGVEPTFEKTPLPEQKFETLAIGVAVPQSSPCPQKIKGHAMSSTILSSLGISSVDEI